MCKERGGGPGPGLETTTENHEVGLVGVLKVN